MLLILLHLSPVYNDVVDGTSGASRGKRWRRADTNIVEVSFRQLTAPSNMHTGDPVYCDVCKAVLSTVSKVERNGDEQVRSYSGQWTSF